MLTNISWQKKLASALTLNEEVAQSRYFQLATIDTDGTPCCRTMVFREFAEAESRLVMHTDLRSDKVGQLNYHKLAEICWYFPQTREQFRLKGKIELICSPDHPLGAQRTVHWRGLSDEVRAGYAQPAIRENKCTTKVLVSNQHLPQEAFALLQLTVDRVDHLQLQRLPHKRWLYQRDNKNSWQSCPIQP